MEELNGALENIMPIQGTLDDTESLNGNIKDAAPLSGALTNEILRGYSAYQLAISNGFIGTMDEWLNSLVGKQGYTPYVGDNNNWFINGADTGVCAIGNININELSNLEIEQIFQDINF